MNKLKISPTLLTGILVALMAIVAFILRVTLSYGQIFKGDWIKYASADAYYHMRVVDVVANNFPHMPAFDMYTIFPGGLPVVGTHMYARFIASIASLFGIITPSQNTIDIVGVFTPPVLLALTVVVVFFIGKELFGKWGGVLSAAMLAIIPGELFSRTKLGFADYHCFEILMTSLFILFVLLALKAARKNELNFGQLIKRNWVVIRRPAIFSLLAGLTFTFYAFAWNGAPLFVFIVFAFFVIQFIMDHFRKVDVNYLAITGSFIFVLPFIILLFVTGPGITAMSTGIALAGCVGMGVISHFLSVRNIRSLYFPVILLVLAGVGLGLFSLISPGLTSAMIQSFSLFNPEGAQLTTIEMQPLISSDYGNAFAIVWNNYNLTFFLAFVAFAILLYRVIKKGSYDNTLLLVWSIVILIANLAQRRFGYYYGVNVSLMMGLLAWMAIDFARSRIFTERLKQELAKAKDPKRKALRKNRGPSILIPYTVMSFVVLIVFFVGYFWSIEPTVEAAKRAPYAPSDAWCSVLTWMKDNTPDPLGETDGYYNLPETGDYLTYTKILEKYPNETGDPQYYKELDAYYPYPESAYGVLAWWDYGYWITRIGHRMPNANPSQDPRAILDVASFMIAQDEQTALEVTERLQTEYVLIDYETAYTNPNSGSGKFWAMVTWSDLPVSDYFDMFLVQDSDDTTKYFQRILYFPEYYRSMAVRMYNFDCEEVVPEEVIVIEYEERPDDSGNILKLIAAEGSSSFATYKEAEEFIASQEEGNFRIIGTEPLISCVPLEKLDHFEVEYESPQGISLISGNLTAQVKLFKHLD